MKNTVNIGLLGTVPTLLLGLVLAHLLNYRLRGRTLFRMGVLLPNITSVAAITLVFVQPFGRDYGFVNWVLGGWAGTTGSSGRPARCPPGPRSPSS